MKKNILITGANGGLGFETSLLVSSSEMFDKVILACRTEKKAKESCERIKTKLGPSLKVELIAAGGFDMNSIEGIEKAVKSLPEVSIQVLFLQSGGVIFSKDFEFIEFNGKRVEKTAFQNVLGAYATLVNLMEAGLLETGARVVFAGGEGARGIPGLIDKPEFQSPEDLLIYLKEGRGNYNPMNGIGVSKFLSALLIRKLAEQRVHGIEALWFSPGLTYGTQGLRNQPPVKRWIMEKLVFGILGLLGLAQSPRSGAKKYFDSLIGKIGKSGEVLGAPEGKALGKISDQLPMNKGLSDHRLIDAFWNFLQGIYPIESRQIAIEKKLEIQL